MKPLLKKMIKYVSLTLLSLMIISLTLVYTLLGTNKGVRYLLDTASDATEGAFKYKKITGHLLSGLKLSHITYNDATMEVSIKEIDFDWQPGELFNTTFMINHLIADGINFKQLQAQVEPESEPQIEDKEKSDTLPEIRLPIDIYLKQLQITNIIIQDDSQETAASSSQPIHINKVTLQSDLIREMINIHTLTLDMSEVNAVLKGNMALKKDYPLSLENNVTLIIPVQAQPNNSEVTITGTVEGDLKTLKLKQKTSGLLELSLEAEATQLLADLQWKADIIINHLALNTLIPEINELITANLSAHGNLNHANTKIAAKIFSSKQQSSEDNKFSQIDVKSKVSWQDVIEWQAELKTNNIDPGQFIKEWPGSLNVDLKTSGQIIDETLLVNLKLEQFSGHLRDHPLAGRGEFNYFQETIQAKTKTKISIKKFNISSGQAQLKANGTINEKLLLDWSLAVTQLSDILPDAVGSIHGQGHLRGTIEAPKISAGLKFNNFHYQDTQFNKAELQCDLNLNPDIASKILINADKIILSSDADNHQVIKQMKVVMDGPLNQHKITALVDHELAKLKLASAGKFDIKQLSWDGTINKLSINSLDIGHWQQSKAARFFTSATKTSLSKLCLKEQSASLCADLNWTSEKNKGKANIHLNKLSFERAKPFFPDEMKEFSGSVDVQANVNLGPMLIAQIKTEITPGTIIYQAINKPAIELNHKNGFIKADYSTKQFLASWNIDLGPHKIDGNLSIPRSAIEKDPMTAPIKGNVDIDIKDLNVVTILVPQINEIKGHLQTRLRLSGNATIPRINGKTELIASLIDIQDLGTQFTDLNITIQGKDNGKTLLLDGGMKSIKGEITLDGQIILDASQGFPVEANIKGENFLAINIPDVYLILTPDIHFRQKKGLMDIKGKLLIPEASISPSSLPEGSVSTSSDVIVLGEEVNTPPNMEVALTVELGKKVHLRAFGLKTDLEGKITVNQQPKQIMVAHGELRLENGTFRAYGQDLTIDEGSVFYAGGYLDNPGLQFSASRRVKETQVGFKVSGTARKPELKTFSDDSSLTDKDIISLMLTGQKTDNLENARIYAGADINDKLSVGVNAGMGDEGSEFVTRYRLTEKVQLEGTSSSAKSGGSILYTFELK